MLPRSISGLTSVSFPDPLHAWGGTDGANILRSTDGGAHWTVRTHLASGVNLYGVDFVSAKTGWVVGGDGTVVRTTDAGAHWTVQDAHTTDQLNGVDFVDARHGWIACNDGTIVATTDGGANWAAQTSNAYTGFKAITFTDADHGWAVGFSGQVDVTTDGGANWTLQDLGMGTRTVNDVAFAPDGQHGYMVALGTILATDDGGTDWIPQQPGSNEFFFGVACADARHAAVVGQLGVVLETVDGGTADWYNPTTNGYAASVTRLHRATLKYRVRDQSPSCGYADGEVSVRTKGGRIVKTIPLWNVRTNVTLKTSFVCKLAKGSYFYFVLATDVAGNLASSEKAGTLTVK